MTPASNIFRDTTGQELTSLEERLVAARQEFFAPGVGGVHGEEGASQEVRRRMVSVFDTAERIMALVRIAKQR